MYVWQRWWLAGILSLVIFVLKFIWKRNLLGNYFIFKLLWWSIWYFGVMYMSLLCTIGPGYMFFINTFDTFHLDSCHVHLHWKVKRGFEIVWVFTRTNLKKGRNYKNSEEKFTIIWMAIHQVDLVATSNNVRNSECRVFCHLLGTALDGWVVLSSTTDTITHCLSTSSVLIDFGSDLKWQGTIQVDSKGEGSHLLNSLKSTFYI